MSSVAHKPGEASEQRLRQLAEILSDFIWEVDAEGRYTYASPSVEKILGYTSEDLVGRMHFYDLFVPAMREELQATAMQVFARRQTFRGFLNPNVRKDGRIVHLETSGMPMVDEAGNLIGYQGADIDVTKRKLAEEALRKSCEEIKALKDQFQVERDYLKTEIRVSQPHHEIIGHSRAIREVLHLVEQVAPTNSAVLLTGETGTGKELLARAIHRLSPRQHRLMVEVNCAALPEPLVESELFGRERGAYTGALTSQVGRFEVADGSTIFLDEVGELSLAIQAKLLRILEEGQFQRLGAPHSHKVNVRVITATNQDLAQAVRQGRFREDLYYRLNVFPIRVPPLRERPEDIPLLAQAFVEEYASRMGKQGLKVPRQMMEALVRHDWPGNIRELRNMVERGVILSVSDTLELALLVERAQPTRAAATLAEVEQQHILKILEQTNWRIKGPHGAAQLLGLKPGTLYSRMRKLGIPHRREKDGIPAKGRDFIQAEERP